MMQVCIICTGWFGRCRAFDNNCPLLGTKSWPVKVQFKGAWFFLFYNQVRVTFLSKPENITRKPSWTVILPSLPRYIILAPRCDITYGRDKWILLMSAHGRQRKYSTAATANVSKQKEKKRLIDSVICHSASGLDADGYGDEEERGWWWWSASRLWDFVCSTCITGNGAFSSITPKVHPNISCCLPLSHWHRRGDSIGSAPLNAPLRIAFESPQLHRCWLGCLATGQHRDHWRKPPPPYETQACVILELLCARLSNIQ